MVKLYGVARSRAGRCLWMLEELGIPYQNVKVNFGTGETKTPDFLAINPNGRMPALEDGDLRLFESLAINLYLARKYDGGEGLWPSTVEDEGRAYQWSGWAMTELEEPLVTALVHRVVLPEAKRDPKRAADAAARFPKVLAVLEGALAGREWLAGDRFTVADLNVASVLLWTKMAGLALDGAPRAAAWLERCIARPALARSQQA